MSFVDCIQAAVTDGRIKQQKADEARQAFEEEMQAARDEGLDDKAASNRAATAAVERLGKTKAEAKWRAINDMKTAAALQKRFANSTNFSRDLTDFSRKIEVSAERIKNQALSLMVGNLEQFRPRAVGLIRPVKNMDNIVRSIYNENVGDQTAQELGTEYINVQEFMRQRANAEGASIPANPNRRLSQLHDRLKVRRVGKAVWVEDHLRDGVMDWDLMRWDGKPIPVDKRQMVLERVYETLSTDGANKIEPGQPSRSHLAAEMSNQRFLYYKTADGWIDMNKKYGMGNAHEQLVGYVETMAQDIALLENLGTNPDGGARYVANLIRKRAGDLDKEGGRTKSKVSEADAAIPGFLNAYDLMARKVPSGADNWAAQAPASFRTYVGSTVLGSASLSALGDLAFAKHTALVNNLPMTGHVRRYLAYLAPLNRGAKQQAIRSAFGAESAIGLAIGAHRYFGPAMGNQLARRYGDVVMRTSGMTPMTQSAQWSWAHEFFGGLADYRNQSWDNLPFRTMLEQNGIGDRDWDIFRQAAVVRSQGAEYLDPGELSRTGTPEQRRVADKFLDAMLMLRLSAVPQADVSTRVALGATTPPGSLYGEINRTVGMLKTFPLLMFTLYGRDLMQRSGTDFLKYAASFAIFTTVGGAMITQLKEIAAGRDPRDMTDPAFWATAMINGGTFGLMGDLVVSGAGDLIGGPSPDALDALREVGAEGVGQFIMGDGNIEGAAIDLGSRFGPFASLWQVKTLMRRALWDQLLMEADPAAYQRLRQYEIRRERETGQRPYWRIGEEFPQRGPDFGRALGQ